MQSDDALKQNLNAGDNLDESMKHAIAKQRGEALLASPHFKSFMNKVKELNEELKNNPKAQMENAKRLW